MVHGNILANEVQVHHGQQSGWSDLRVPLPAALAEEITLKFLHPTPMTPSSFENSQDDRPLAFMFKQAAISSTDAAAPDKISVYPALDGGDLPNRHRHPIALVQAAPEERGEAATMPTTWRTCAPST